MTDHKPLCKVLGLTESILSLAVAKMQRWALMLLGAYQYDIQCISGKLNQCADCMSRLPIVSTHDSAEEILSIMEIDTLSITANQIAKATTSDPTL